MRLASAQPATWGLPALTVALACFIDLSPELLLVLCALAAALLVTLLRDDPAADGARSGTWAMLLALALAVTVAATHKDLGRLQDGKARVWNVYHYYLGSEYFAELGYTDLYVATLAADREGNNYWRGKVREVRDLNTYEVVSANRAVKSYDWRARFTPERWQAFKEDVAALAPQRSAASWRGIFVDRGYNPPPVWTATGRLFTTFIDPSPQGLKLLAMLDVLLVALTAALIARTFGAPVAILALLLFVLSPANIARAVGGFLQFDWFCAIAAGVCLLKRQRHLLAGMFLAYAVMTRVFPLFLLAAWFLPVLRELIASRRLPPYALRFAAGCVAGAIGLFLFSLLFGGGVDAWADFVTAMTVHSGDHALGERRIGLEHLFSADFTALFEPMDKVARAENLAASAAAFWSAATALLAATVVAAWRTDADRALLLGIFVVFSVLVLSRYYYAVLVLLPLLARDTRGAALVGLGQVLVYLLFWAVAVLTEDRHIRYVILNVGLSAYFFAVATWMVVRAPVARGALSAATARPA